MPTDPIEPSDLDPDAVVADPSGPDEPSDTEPAPAAADTVVSSGRLLVGIAAVAGAFALGLAIGVSAGAPAVAADPAGSRVDDDRAHQQTDRDAVEEGRQAREARRGELSELSEEDRQARRDEREAAREAREARRGEPGVDGRTQRPRPSADRRDARGPQPGRTPASGREPGAERETDSPRTGGAELGRDVPDAGQLTDALRSELARELDAVRDEMARLRSEGLLPRSGDAAERDERIAELDRRMRRMYDQVRPAER